MADNVTTQTTLATPPSGTVIGGYLVPLSGDNALIAPNVPGSITGSEGAWTFAPYSSSNPLPVSDAGGNLSVDDGGSTLSIDDGAGSITVDGTVGVSGNVSVVGTGSAGTANAGVVTVQGIAAMTPIQVGDNSSSLSVDDNGSTLSIDDGAGSITVDGTVGVSGTVTVQGNSPAASIYVNARLVDGTNYLTPSADATHDSAAASTGPQVMLGSVAHGSNPTAVSAAGDAVRWISSRAGVPFVIGGHPNIVTIEAAYTAAQTDTAIITISTGSKIVVTACGFVCDKANTVDVGVRVGFGSITTPTTTGVVLTHPGIAAGSGYERGNGSGIIGIGGDGEDLRVTCEVPTSGSARVIVTYYTIES